MKKILLLSAVAFAVVLSACSKDELPAAKFSVSELYGGWTYEYFYDGDITKAEPAVDYRDIDNFDPVANHYTQLAAGEEGKMVFLPSGWTNEYLAYDLGIDESDLREYITDEYQNVMTENEFAIRSYSDLYNQFLKDNYTIPLTFTYIESAPFVKGKLFPTYLSDENGKMTATGHNIIIKPTYIKSDSADRDYKILAQSETRVLIQANIPYAGSNIANAPAYFSVLIEKTNPDYISAVSELLVKYKK